MRSIRHKTVFGLLLFNAVSAIGGGIALMVGVIPEQPSWVRHTDFTSLYFPGVILMSLVGGSALVAAVAMLKRTAGAQLACISSGTIMIMWIVGEIASIRAFHFLQVIYLGTGALIIWWTSESTTSSRSNPPTNGSAYTDLRPTSRGRSPLLK